MRYDERVDNKESEINMTNLTQKEQDQVKRLIKLGDSLELAIKTVLDLRDEPDNTEFYYNAYCL